MTETQEFLKEYYATHYSERHRIVGESGESEMVNSYIPSKCPYCTSANFKRSGKTQNGFQQSKNASIQRCFPD